MKRNLFFIITIFYILQPALSIEIQGHRGARWVRPENTIPAFEYALEVGVDTLELDTLITKDGKVVVHHDPTLNSTICLDSNGKKIKTQIPIYSLTLKELKTYDCGTLVNPRFPEQIPQPKVTIPTLEEVLLWVKNSKHPVANKVLFNIEAKSDINHPEFAPSPEEFVKLIITEIKKQNLLSRVTLQSFDLRCLKAARELEPSLSLSVLLEDRPPGKEGLIQLIKDYKAQILSPNFEWLKPQDVTALHKIGTRVIPWTPNSKKEWSELIEMGVDGIITDNPKELLNYITEFTAKELKNN